MRISAYLRRAWLLAALAACGPTTTGDETGTPPPHGPRAGAPSAAGPAIEFGKDGTVIAAGRRYASVVDFQRSPEFRQGGRRCASGEPVMTEALREPADCSMSSTTIRAEYNAGAMFEIPVVFHVVQRESGEGALTDELLRSQIDVLNEDFGALAGTPGAPGADTRIRFVLATIDPQGNPTTGINRHTSDAWFNDPGPRADNPMKRALAWDPRRYFNIYTNDSAGALGYAVFPPESAGNYDDGVVLLWSSVGRGNPQGGIYNQGRTATHEVGHYLGLFHTFQGGCGSASAPYTSGDLVADTSPESGPQFECAMGSSCAGGLPNPIENYMDYTPDACMNRFSREQLNRMRCSMLNYREGLFRVIPNDENVPPDAAFGHQATALEVAFTDRSGDADGTIASWSWDLGDGTTSTEQHPRHTYAQAGTYTVTLTVTDDRGATDSASAEVSVRDAGPPPAGLENGVPLPDLEAPAGGGLALTFVVPEGATDLRVTTAGGTGDADLYLRLGEAPTTSTYDHRSWRWGNGEEIAVAAPGAGTWHVLLDPWEAFAGVTLTMSFTAPSP